MNNQRWLSIEKGLSVTAASAIMGAGMIARALSTFLIFLDDLGVNGFYIGVILNIAILFEIFFYPG